MSTANGTGLIDYLLQNGRDMSWFELAKKFGFDNPENARTLWRTYRFKMKPHVQVIPPPIRVLSPEVRVAKEEYLMDLEDKVTRFEEDFAKGTAQVEALVGQEIKTLDELVTKCNIDLTKWQITKWIQNFWNNKYQVKVFLAPIEQKDVFQSNFIEFLKDYKPTIVPAPTIELNPEEIAKALREQGVSDFNIPKGCLVISKQDLHFNKLDIKGDNDIEARFKSYESAVDRIIHKALLSYSLGRIVYVIGSDEFNSEWMGTTTKGTPQQNMIGYHEGFARICTHETRIIEKLASYGRTVNIIYMPGNHDEYVGWHMITWLNAFFRDRSNILWETSPGYRKYILYNNTGMMFNHGDVIKPQKLAGIFPQEFKEHWSSTDYQYIFTGDKHNELTMNIDGILFYQLTQGSNATSKWDEKQGYQAKGFLTAFVISEKWGLADQYLERL